MIFLIHSPFHKKINYDFFLLRSLLFICIKQKRNFFNFRSFFSCNLCRFLFEFTTIFFAASEIRILPNDTDSTGSGSTTLRLQDSQEYTYTYTYFRLKS